MKTTFSRFSVATFIFFFAWAMSSDAQITAPPPQEISGGAQAALHRVKIKKWDTITHQAQPNVSTPSPVIEAVDLPQNITNTGGFINIPPDPCGAAGPNHLVNVVNTSIEWFTKAGVRQNTQSLKSFFTSPTLTFDPKVIYDQYNGRFVVVTLEQEGRNDMMTATDKSRIYIAVSKTNDPNDGWWKFSYDALTVISSENTWADYPGFAVDEEAIYVACNMFAHEGMPFGTNPDTTSFGGVRLWIIPKGDGSGGAYDGGSLNESIYDPYSGGGFAMTTQPAHTLGTISAGVGTYLLSYGGLSDMAANDYVQLVRVNNPITTPTFTITFVSLGNIENPASAIPDAPQMGSDSLIDSGPRRAFNAVWRDGIIATCFNMVGSGANAGQATAHWVLINANGVAAPTLADQGDVGGEDVASGTYTYYPSVALNSNGDLAIGFSASAPTIYAGAYYTGREMTDPAGTTDPVETLRAGVAPYERTLGNSRNRWGDYNSTVVDPSDDSSFWAYNEYAMTTGNMTTMPDEDGRWATAYGKFTVSDCLADWTLDGTIAAGTYTVSNILTATGTINSPSMVFFNAGNEIKLDPDFTINLGASLEASIAGCP